MRKKMRLLFVALPLAIVGEFLLSLAPPASAQRVRQRIIIVQPFDPFFPGPYPYYPYPVYNMPPNYGQVKIETKQKNASVYIDGGFASTTDKDKKFALRPGQHDIELRNSDGQALFHERVTVSVGHTTKLRVS
jgi:hypothetical protein